MGVKDVPTDADSYVPRAIVRWVRALPTTGKADRYRQRLSRFVEFGRGSYEDGEKLSRHWGTVEKKAIDENKLITLFMVMPDKPEEQPFAALFGWRPIDPGEERSRYDAYLAHLLEIERLLRSQQFRNLLSDSGLTSEASTAGAQFREIYPRFREGLQALKRLLELVDPTAKIPTPQYKSSDAALKNYVILVARLNLYLKRPAHSALAFLANVNSPSSPVTADQIRKAWFRHADKLA